MTADQPAVGDVVELEVGPVAHGGHCVARRDGRVFFVRHALPGERVTAEVTDVRARFVRADAVDVIEASPHRVVGCRYSGPGGCGGCDWQHADLEAQRAGKAAVVVEALVRLGRLDPALPIGTAAAAGGAAAGSAGIRLDQLTVEEVGVPDRPRRTADGPPADPPYAGRGWRTRVQFTVDDSGRLGLRAHRSHRVVRVEHCPIADPEINRLELHRRRWPGCERVEVIASGAGDLLLVLTPRPGARVHTPSTLGDGVSVVVAGELRPRRGRAWVGEPIESLKTTARVSGSGFWQVHPGAADTLVRTVTRLVGAEPGHRILDLYSGVGLFSLALAPAVGATGSVTAVESDRRAVADARRNLHEHPQVRIIGSTVLTALRAMRHPADGPPSADGDGTHDQRMSADRAGPSDRVNVGPAPGEPVVDAVVLDPPRTGAGAEVIGELARLGPPVIVYVACDPASLARDAALLAGHGYRLDALFAFDLFPHTQHVECVARFVDVSG